MSRWLRPLAAGLAASVGAYWLTLYLTPDVLMAAAFQRVSAGGINRFSHSPLATSASRQIVRPSPDLAYSACPFDLTNGPVLIDAVPVDSPYWSLAVFNSRTDTAFVANNTGGATANVRIAIVRDDQQPPAGYRAVRVPGKRGIALVRIFIADKATFPAIDEQRRKTTCRPA